MIHLYSADRALPLAGRVADILEEPPADPMTPEWLAVPSDGMRRWLMLELARRLGAGGPGGGDGVAANIVRAYPGTLRSSVLTADRGDPECDPWAIHRLVWPVLAVTRRRRRPTPDWLRSTGWHRVRPATRRPAGWPTCSTATTCTDRPWSGPGRPARTSTDPGAGWPTPHRGNPTSGVRCATRWARRAPRSGGPGCCNGWPEGDLILDLPPRFDVLRVHPAARGRVPRATPAVARQRDVHLFLLEPSHFDPEHLRRAGGHPPAGTPRLRSDDSTAVVVDQPLLRSWGRLHRETALLIADAEAGGLPERQWVHGESSAGPSGLLGRLQRDIRANAGSGAPLVHDPADRSVQFHACFGATRQVEVLRDVLLHLFNDPDLDLDEDDVLVVCPAIETFAPLIQAVFGPSAEVGTPARQGPSAARGAPALRYRIADQSIRSTNPLLNATVALIELVGGRFEAPAVLDFLALGPVRERFRFDDDDLNDIADWVNGACVRWGLDPSHRASFGVPEAIRTNTWQAALDRLLVGATVHDDDLLLAVGDVAPYGVDGSATDIVGRLAEALWHLQRLVVPRRARPGHSRPGSTSCAGDVRGPVRHRQRRSMAVRSTRPDLRRHARARPPPVTRCPPHRSTSSTSGG